MSGQELDTPSIFTRATGVLRSRRLKRFTGTDLTVIERKVTDYYASHTGEAYYARLAEQKLWDDMVRHKHFEFHCQAAQEILDFGCGAGGLSVALSQHYPEKHIHAIDIGTHAAALIAQAKANVDFQPGSVLDAPLEDASIDMLISRFVIEHTIHPEKLISEANRVLRPNGIIYLLYPQLLLKVTFATALREVLSWVFSPDRLTYLDPQIGDTTSDADDQDAVWLTNPFKISRLLRSSGFQIVSNVPTQSLVIARKR
jgi:ubiquinone/menaquinone biosynthesis C-methylase UbiE